MCPTSVFPCGTSGGGEPDSQDPLDSTIVRWAVGAIWWDFPNDPAVLDALLDEIERRLVLATLRNTVPLRATHIVLYLMLI